MLAWIVASTVALSAVDLRVRCLPTRMVWTMGSGLAVLAVPEALVDPVAVHREALAGLLLASAVALIVVVVRGLRGAAVGTSLWPSACASACSWWRQPDA